MSRGFQAEEKPCVRKQEGDCSLFRKLSWLQTTRRGYTVYAGPWWETRRHVGMDLGTRITVLMRLDVIA